MLSESKNFLGLSGKQTANSERRPPAIEPSHNSCTPTLSDTTENTAYRIAAQSAKRLIFRLRVAVFAAFPIHLVVGDAHTPHRKARPVCSPQATW